MGQLFLILTILTESAAVLFMKLSNGFQDKLQAALAIVCYAASFVFLTLALKTLPAGITNALWAGCSTVLVAVVSIYIFKEQLSTAQIIFLALIVTGIVGLNFTGSVN